MKIKKVKKTILLLSLSAIIILVSNLWTFSAKGLEINNEEIERIQKEIEIREANIKQLETQRKIYQEKISIKRSEISTLKDELDFINNKINKSQLAIESQEEEISKTDLSIQKIQLEIIAKKKEAEGVKEQLRELLLTIHEYDQKNPLEIILLNPSLSSVFNHWQYLNSCQEKIARNLQRISTLKEGLEIQEEKLRQERQNLVNLKNELDGQKIQLIADKEINEYLLEQTRGAEWKFQSLLAEVITEQQKIDQEISSLEKTARAKIAQEKERQAELMEKEGILIFSWPVPLQKITSPFHDPEYPFRHLIGEHPAIDLRAQQGTLVRASASGYVARAKEGGVGEYSYVMIIHNNSFSTVYGHLSDVQVKENEYIKRGEVIGLSGGMPGTPGAGMFCTGPHLHFEIRMNGIPVNPEDYLL
jgi:murein DD-endopeptidase MepM/ murein hydrolase activator NlpD